MKEVWKSIPGFERYQASSRGRLYSTIRGRILRQTETTAGFYSVNICPVVGVVKHLSVHRAVLLAFKGYPPKGKPEAAHLDGSRTNNEVSNLRWVSCKENHGHRLAHGTRQQGENVKAAKLTEAFVLDIRALYPRYNIVELATRFKVSTSTIWSIIQRDTWKHV